MSEYAIEFARSARKELEKLERSAQARIFARIESLGAEPRPQGVHKLRAADNLWRIRVGQYRVIYSINDASRTVEILFVRHRSDAYR